MRKCIAREAHYNDEIYAINGTGTPQDALADLKKGMASDYKQKISRTTPPRKGEIVPVREFFDDGTENDWVGYKVP